jgi:hypothetical protein
LTLIILHLSDQGLPSMLVELPNKLSATDPNTTVTIQELQAEMRQNAMQAQTLHKGGAKTSTGSGSLQIAVAKGAPRQITVYLVPMTSTGTRTDASRILPNATRAFPEDMPMAGGFSA